MGAFSADQWLIPIEITASNNVLAVKEATASVGVFNNTFYVTVNPGTYYLHNSSTLTAAGYTGLYDAIIDIVDEEVLGGSSTYGSVTGTVNVTLGGFLMTAEDPVQSSGVTDAGHKLVVVGVDDIGFAWTDASNTMDARYFGLLDAEPSSDSEAGGTTLISDYCIYGRLRTFDLLDGAATDKTEIPRKMVEFSSDRVSDSVATNWGTEYDRIFTYEDVWPAMVDRNRAKDTPYATISGLGDGDVNNSWWYVWDALADGKTCIVIHNYIASFTTGSDGYSVVKLVEDLPWESFQTPIDDGGDMRRISFRASIIEETYSH